VGECLNFYQNWNCERVPDEAEIRRTIQACQKVWIGTKGEGEACRYASGLQPCKPGLYCHPDPSAGSTCRKSVQEGEPCDLAQKGAFCDAGLFCGEDKRCQKALPEGAACTQVSQCDTTQGLVCMEGKCALVIPSSSSFKTLFCE